MLLRQGRGDEGVARERRGGDIGREEKTLVIRGGGAQATSVTGEKGRAVSDPGDVLGGLAHGLEDVSGGRQVDIFKIAHSVSIHTWILHLSNILHHLHLKLCVHRAWLNHRDTGRNEGRTKERK